MEENDYLTWLNEEGQTKTFEELFALIGKAWKAGKEYGMREIFREFEEEGKTQGDKIVVPNYNQIKKRFLEDDGKFD
jgi:hypothetical protein